MADDAVVFEGMAGECAVIQGFLDSHGIESHISLVGEPVRSGRSALRVIGPQAVQAQLLIREYMSHQGESGPRYNYPKRQKQALLAVGIALSIVGFMFYLFSR